MLEDVIIVLGGEQKIAFATTIEQIFEDAMKSRQMQRFSLQKFELLTKIGSWAKSLIEQLHFVKQIVVRKMIVKLQCALQQKNHKIG